MPNDLYTMAPSQIVMYTTEYCSDCHRAKAFFEANNIRSLFGLVLREMKKQQNLL